MNRTLLLTVALSCSALCLQAQNNAIVFTDTARALKIAAALYQPNKFELSVEGGPGMIFLFGNSSITPNARPGVGGLAGLFFQYNFKMVFALRSGIEYARKGEYESIQGVNNNGNTTNNDPVNVHDNFDYLTLPVLVRTSFGRKAKFFFNVGPYFSLLLKQQSVFRQAGYDNTQSDNTARLKRFDAGFVTGAGVSVAFTIGKGQMGFNFEVQNSTGIYDLDKLPVAFSSGRVLTNSINVLTGFVWRFGERKPSIPINSKAYKAWY